MKVTISISSTDLAKLREYMAKHMRDVKAQVSWLTPADLLTNEVLVNAKKERDDKYCRAVIPTISGTEE